MSKLWIIHRSPQRRDALAHLSGLAAPDLVCGAPTDPAFATATAPAALLLAPEGDFELELDFLHRHRDALARTRRSFLATPEDADEVRRLFEAADTEILDDPPSERGLRALVLSGVSHRNAESLAERRDRERVTKRFSRWFGDVEIPGLLRALDPALAGLPLLVRGVPGSGRTLLARYAELFRGASGPVLRLDARELTDIDELAGRLRARDSAGLPSAQTVWIDGVDACSAGFQRALAEWIRLGAAPARTVGAALRWIATASPRGPKNRLDTDLERAFAPLELTIPAIIDHPDALASFAERVAADWTETVGGVPRRIAESTFVALEAQAWAGDRSAVEAMLRSTFAATGPTAETAQPPQASIEADDLAARARATERIPVEDASFLDDPTPDLTHETFDRAAAEPDSHPPDAHPMADFPDDALFATSARAGERPAQQPGERLDPAHGQTPAAISPPIEDFERAFREGLSTSGSTPRAISGSASGATSRGTPEVSPSVASGPAPGMGSETRAPGISSAAKPALDPSTQFSNETFEVAAKGVVDPPKAPPTRTGSDSWRRLARSLSHEIRNPLVSIRTFTELLPEHFGDESFRERFTELVGRDVAHIDEVVSRLADAAAPDKLAAGPVDVSALLERLLDARRERIGRGRLLVLRELEREAPIAWVDAHALEVALAGLLDRALATLPERGDLFVATRRIERSADGTPRLRVLLRHHNPGQSELGAADRSGLEELGAGANLLEYVLAETVVEASGGTLTIDSTDAQETLILVDLLTS